MGLYLEIGKINRQLSFDEIERQRQPNRKSREMKRMDTQLMRLHRGRRTLSETM